MTEALPQRSVRSLRLRKVRRTVLVAIVVFVALLFAARALVGGPENPSLPSNGYPVQKIEAMPKRVLKEGETFDAYNSRPPTSGPHTPAGVPWGVHAAPVPKEALVKNMADGGAVAWYNCAAPPALAASECEKLVTELTAIVTSLTERKVVLVPAPELDHRIALTAWTLLDVFEDYDVFRVRSFFRFYAQRRTN